MGFIQGRVKFCYPVQVTDSSKIHQDACYHQDDAKDEITADLRAWADRLRTDKEDDYVGYVPDFREAKLWKDQ